MLTASVAAADEKEVISYEDQIKPIFGQHCVACHGEDKQTADLNLQTYAAVLKGGSGGEAVVAGRASQSALFKAITDPDDNVRMPPKKPPIPKEQIELIQKWIDSGLRETASSKSQMAGRDLKFTPAVGVGGKARSVADAGDIAGGSLAEDAATAGGADHGCKSLGSACGHRRARACAADEHRDAGGSRPARLSRRGAAGDSLQP